jgi:hypothetical protein
MALSKEDTKSSNKLYVLKVKTKDLEGKPAPVHFQVSEKNVQSGKWVPTGEIKNVTGDIVSVNVTDEVFNDEPYHAVKITLEDNEAKESYILDAKFNMLSRSLFNSLLSLKSHKDIKIGVYQTAAKEGRESYAAISVRQAGEKVSWAYEIKDLPPVTEVKAGTKVIKVYDDLNEFFIPKLKNLNEKVKGWRKADATKEVKEVKPVQEAAAEPPEPSDDF